MIIVVLSAIHLAMMAVLLQLGILDTNLCLAYTCKFQEEESKMRIAVR